MLHDDVDTLEVRDLANFLRDLLLVMIDDEISAEFAGQRHLAIVSGGGDHAGVKHLRDLDGGDSDSGISAKDEHGLPWPEFREPNQHVPRRHKYERHAGGLVEVERIGNGNDTGSGHSDQFAVTAID